MNKFVKRLILSVSLGYMNLTLFRPDQPSQFSATAFAVSILSMSRSCLRFSNRPGAQIQVPGLSVAFIVYFQTKIPKE